MSKHFVKPSTATRVPPAAIAAAWIFAITVPSLLLHTNRVRAAQREAEERILSQVATAVRSPGASREEIMALLARHQNELIDTRYVRACNRLGITMNWNTLFEQISRRNKDEQAKAAQVIAEECRLQPGTTLKSEQMTLALSLVQNPQTEQTTPIRLPVRRAID